MGSHGCHHLLPEGIVQVPELGGREVLDPGVPEYHRIEILYQQLAGTGIVNSVQFLLLTVRQVRVEGICLVGEEGILHEEGGKGIGGRVNPANNETGYPLIRSQGGTRGEELDRQTQDHCRVKPAAHQGECRIPKYKGRHGNEVTMPNPQTLTSEPRIFVDLVDVERMENVSRVYHQAARYGAHPVLKQEAPWEKHSGMTASVIFDDEDGLFKAWYLSGFYAPGEEHVQCYATSKDGVNWDRPSLGIHEALGSVDNNIVIPASHHEGKDHWETMVKDTMEIGPDRLENIAELNNAASRFTRENPEAGTLEYVEQISLIADIDGYEENASKVSLMTLHTAKGLEFLVVFIGGLEEGLLPHRRSIEDGRPAELEEERRLFYVGMTRAKDRLCITLAKFRDEFGQPSRQIESRFLSELDLTHTDLIDLSEEY